MSPETWHSLVELGAVMGSTAGSFVGSLVAAMRTRHLIKRQDPSIAYTAKMVERVYKSIAPPGSDPPPAHPPLQTLDEQKTWDEVVREARKR